MTWSIKKIVNIVDMGKNEEEAMIVCSLIRVGCLILMKYVLLFPLIVVQYFSVWTVLMYTGVSNATILITSCDVSV